MPFKSFKVRHQVLLIPIGTYLLFFFKLLSPSNIIYSGKDAVAFHYPSKIYLAQNLEQGNFPFWSENMFLGFPLYADMERGYFNPVNLLLVKYFGPFTSYKILHFACYIIGSLSLYLFLKKYGTSTRGFLAASTIYFFSFFALYHQQHFNMVLTYYLFPLGLVLLDKFLSHKQFRYLLYNSTLLAFCFYLGSFQFILLFVLLETFYLLAHLKLSKQLVGYSLYTLVLFLILSLPGIFSTYNLYAQSVRSTSLEYTQGSYSPAMFINVIFPFLFNFEDVYMGSLVSRDYFMHEVYTYGGISAFIFTLVGYLYLKDKKLKTFLNYLIGTFFVLAFIGAAPVLQNINFLPFSLFRYWARSVAFLNLVSAVLVYQLIASTGHLSLREIRLKLKNAKIVFTPLLYLALLSLFSIISNLKNLGELTDVKILHLLLRDDYQFGYWYFLWFLFFIFSLALLVSRISYKKQLISLLIFVDILSFGFIGTKNSLIKAKDEVFPFNVSTEFINTRVLDLSGVVNGDNALLHQQWGAFGYSVLYPKNTAEALSGIGITSTRYPNTVETPGNFNNLAKLGIKKAIQPNGEVLAVSNDNYLLDTSDKNIGAIENYEYKNGSMGFDVAVHGPTLLQTYIRNYPGWRVMVNSGDTAVDAKTDALFISIPLTKGNHHVTLQFIPQDLYNGIKISGILLALFTVISAVSIKKHEHSRL